MKYRVGDQTFETREQASKRACHPCEIEPVFEGDELEKLMEADRKFTETSRELMCGGFDER